MDSMHSNTMNPRGSTAPSSTSVSDGLADRLLQGAHEAVDRVGVRAAPTIERLSESASAARHALGNNANKLAALQGEMLDSARNYVRERPFTAIAAAALIGALAIGLMRSR